MNRSLTLVVLVMLSILGGCGNPAEPENMVSKPVFTPAGGIYNSGQYVTITTNTLGSTIFYTTDNSTPNSGSMVYEQPILIAANTVLKAKAFRSGFSDSKLASANYVFDYSFPPEDFVLVEGGTFSNGTSDVTLTSFYIDKYELTQAGYQAVMGSDPASGYGDGDTYPVYEVSWFKSIVYCNRRSLQEGLVPCYSYLSYGTDPDTWPTGWDGDMAYHSNVSCDWTADGYRLPTDMEWMYAAQGGNQAHNYTYSGSNDLNAVGWYGSNSGNTTHTVGTKAANELGIFDMSGNVWEWCWDIYGSYPSGAQSNPHGAISGSYRVVRGGSWLNPADFCLVSSRTGGSASNGQFNIGFRCVRVFP